MSSPQQVPQYPPPPPQYPPPNRPYRGRSLAGPIVLILVGILFLFANMGVITWVRFGEWFSRYWPVLIILWGAIKLVEYYQAQRGGYRPRGLGAGGVFFLIFMIFVGISATRASRFNWNQIGEDMDMDNNMFSWFGTTYTYDDQIEQPFTAGSSVQVVSDHGDINLNSWDENKIKIVVHKRVVSDSEDSAKKANESTRPVVTTATSLITINANTAGAGQTRVASDLDIYLPASAAVDISSRHGDVVVHTRAGNVKVASTHGDITVQDVKGDASLLARRGSVRAEDVTGDLTVEGRLSEGTFNNIGGSFHLNGDVFGSMKLGKVGKSVQFTSSRTDMHFGKLDGQLTLDSGDMRASQLAGPFSVVTRSKDIHLDDVAGDVRVEDTNGEVEIQVTKLPLGNIDVQNRNGQVRVTVPSKAMFQIEAKTRRGDIESEFNEVKVDTSHGESTGSGSVGSGGARIQINNEHGGIAIRKAG
jgi:DUF4097 and DUF4098 domain-containing protein YvlB